MSFMGNLQHGLFLFCPFSEPLLPLSCCSGVIGRMARTISSGNVVVLTTRSVVFPLLERCMAPHPEIVNAIPPHSSNRWRSSLLCFHQADESRNGLPPHPGAMGSLQTRPPPFLSALRFLLFVRK